MTNCARRSLGRGRSFEKAASRPPANLQAALMLQLPDRRRLAWLFIIKALLLAAGLATPLFYKIFVDNVLINKDIHLLSPSFT
jgi:ABC-type bacteriocin/lantibiotic exporter with double-glycine peptidase domain